MKKSSCFAAVWIASASIGCGAAGGAGLQSQSGPDRPPTKEAELSSDAGPQDAGEVSASSPGSNSNTEPKGAADEPQFAPGMSVVEATNAVPDSIQRFNIEQEALAAPLMEPELYEPCELQGYHHFKVRVAVWDGRAVGIDITTQPSDEKLESCLRQQLSNVEWKDKAKSINTAEYRY